MIVGASCRTTSQLLLAQHLHPRLAAVSRLRKDNRNSTIVNHNRRVSRALVVSLGRSRMVSLEWWFCRGPKTRRRLWRVALCDCVGAADRIDVLRGCDGHIRCSHRKFYPLCISKPCVLYYWDGRFASIEDKSITGDLAHIYRHITKVMNNQAISQERSNARSHVHVTVSQITNFYIKPHFLLAERAESSTSHIRPTPSCFTMRVRKGVQPSSHNLPHLSLTNHDMRARMVRAKEEKVAASSKTSIKTDPEGCPLLSTF